MTTPQINPFTASAAQMKHWLGVSKAVNGSLDQTLVHLVEIRASQINGCANCLNMHTEEARAQGRDRAAHLPALGLAARRPATPTASAPRSAGPTR